MTRHTRMKIVKRVAFAVVGFGVALLLGGSTYSYDLRCTKCLLGKSVVVQRCFGIPFYRSSTKATRAADYDGIFGQPCRHVLRTGGFARSSYSMFGGSIGCGTTADGAFLRYRIRAVATTYELAKRLDDKQTARDTFAIIDRLMPPDTRRSGGAYMPSELLYLSWYLDKVTTREEWLEALRCATNDFHESPNVPDA